MDFGPAKAFDEQDVINAIATESTPPSLEGADKRRWFKRAQYMVFG